MYLRMLLLSLGFPARDPFECAAQKAMHRLHKLMMSVVLRGALRILFLFTLLGFVIGATFAALLFVVFVMPIFVAFLCVYFFRGQPLSNLGLVYHPGLSHEVALLCKQADTTEIPVFIDDTKVGIYAGINHWSNRRIVFSPAALHSPSVVRQGIFAHELGHLFLPLRNMDSFFEDIRVMHAREFAADAIGACLLRDARPVLFCLVELLRLTPVEERYRLLFASKSHPPLPERIKRLLDLNVAARHAR